MTSERTPGLIPTLTRGGRAVSAAAVRVERALAAHPVRWAVRLTVLFTAFVFLFLTPTFESNDDVAMMFIADGTFYGEPQPHLVYQHALVGLGLSSLYRWTTAVDWYAVWLYSLHAAALGVLAYLVFSDQRVRLLPRLAGLVAFGSAFTLWMWVNVQFTAVAITIGAAGILLHTATAGRVRLPGGVPVLAGALLAVSAFVRWRSFQAVVILAVPLLVAGARRIPWRRNVVFAASTLAIVLAGGIFQTLYYAGDDAWHEYFEFNAVRGAIHSTEKMTAARDPEVLAALGWSRADYEMFRTWFYLDDQRYSTDTLRTLADEVGTPLRSPVEVLDLTNGLDRLTRLAVLVGLAGAAWAVSDRRGLAVLAATTGWFVAVVTAVAMTARLPDRVAVPTLAYLGMIYLVRPHTACGDGYLPRRPAARWAALAGLLVVALLAAGVAWPRTAADSARWNRQNDAFAATMDELARFDPDGVYVSWGGSAGTLRVSPELSERVPVTIVPLGWHQRSPMHHRRLAELGIDDLYEAIALDERVCLTLAAGEPEAEWYVRYMEEHYGFTGFLRPSAVVDTDGRLTVYDLLIAGYALDEERGVLVEERGDGTTVELPIVRSGVAGTFRSPPDRAGTLTGWAVDVEERGPVRRIVVIRSGQLVAVLPTAYLRPGEAAAHGVDETARIGFVAAGLPAGVADEARVFALDGYTAVELVRGAG